MKLVEGITYTLSNKDGSEKVTAYYYNNPDFYMDPKEPLIEGKDYSQLGFGFNIADGGGFLPEFDVKADTLITLTFGQAIEAAKADHKVARKGWNGSGMFAYIVPANSYPAQTEMIKGVFENDMVPYRAYWALKTAQNDVAAWSPSGSDSLAEDWVIVD